MDEMCKSHMCLTHMKRGSAVLHSLDLAQGYRDKFQFINKFNLSLADLCKPGLYYCVH